MNTCGWVVAGLILIVLILLRSIARILESESDPVEDEHSRFEDHEFY